MEIVNPYMFAGVGDFTVWLNSINPTLLNLANPTLLNPIESEVPKTKRGRIARNNPVAIIPKCTEVGCPNDALFGLPYVRHTHCFKHKTPLMINHNKCCKLCPKTAAFGFKGEAPIYCKSDKLKGMVNVLNFGCNYEGCDTTASFGLDFPTVCSKHNFDKFPNLNLGFAKCSTEGCKTTASFGFKLEKSVKCAAHKEKWMYHARKKSKLCKFEQCESTAHYDGYCFDHNDDNLVPVHPVYEPIEMECVTKGKRIKLSFVPMKSQ